MARPAGRPAKAPSTFALKCTIKNGVFSIPFDGLEKWLNQQMQAGITNTAGGPGGGRRATASRGRKPKTMSAGG